MKTISIGRSSQCDIVIADEKISRHHADISVVGSMYVYKDLSKNGAVLGGEVISNRSITVAPGAPILLAGRIPLPWPQIYALLPLSGVRPYDEETHVDPTPVPVQPVTPASDDNLGVGLGIVAFLIPLAGWIMYFCMKSETPHRASQAAMWAWIGFGVNCLLSLLSIA